jgi:hypothetical protein
MVAIGEKCQKYYMIQPTERLDYDGAAGLGGAVERLDYGLKSPARMIINLAGLTCR